MKNYYAVKHGNYILPRTFSSNRLASISKFLMETIDVEPWSFFKRKGYKTVVLVEKDKAK